MSDGATEMQADECAGEEAKLAVKLGHSLDPRFVLAEKPETVCPFCCLPNGRHGISCAAGAKNPQVSDGSTASYYELPLGAAELQDLIAFRDMNAQIGEIFRACYRYGRVEHSPKIRDIKKIIFYAQAELARLKKYEVKS